MGSELSNPVVATHHAKVAHAQPVEHAPNMRARTDRIENTQVEHQGQWASIVELTKPRITKLVVITAGVGYALTAIQRTWDVRDLVMSMAGCIAGTAMSSAGAGAINMWSERDRDARMDRTRNRPLPLGKLSPPTALTVGVLLSVLGVLVLSWTCGPAPALVSGLTILLYVFVYTPLKTRTTLNTIVGTLPGALPPMIGVCCATPWRIGGEVKLSAMEANLESLGSIGGWSLVVMMMMWQVPHFLALAWMYRDDYERGGYRMLPILDADGGQTTRAMAVWALALVPASVMPVLFMPKVLGVISLAIALVSGCAYAVLCLQMLRAPTRTSAKRVFLGSIMHLPLLMIAYVVDAVVHAGGKIW